MFMRNILLKREEVLKSWISILLLVKNFITFNSREKTLVLDDKNLRTLTKRSVSELSLLVKRKLVVNTFLKKSRGARIPKKFSISSTVALYGTPNNRTTKLEVDAGTWGLSNVPRSRSNCKPVLGYTSTYRFPEQVSPFCCKNPREQFLKYLNAFCLCLTQHRNLLLFLILLSILRSTDRQGQAEEICFLALP